MSLVIILYLTVLSAFTLGYLYKGVSLLKNEIDEPGRKRIRLFLKAQENDVVNFQSFRKHDARLSILMGLFYFSIVGFTFQFVPHIAGTLTIREIHLVRTCIIAGLFLHLSREMWMISVSEKFVTRNSGSESAGYNLKTAGAFALISLVLVYSIYTQMTYSWY